MSLRPFRQALRRDIGHDGNGELSLKRCVTRRRRMRGQAHALLTCRTGNPPPFKHFRLQNRVVRDGRRQERRRNRCKRRLQGAVAGQRQLVERAKQPRARSEDRQVEHSDQRADLHQHRRQCLRRVDNVLSIGAGGGSSQGCTANSDIAGVAAVYPGTDRGERLGRRRRSDKHRHGQPDDRPAGNDNDAPTVDHPDCPRRRRQRPRRNRSPLLSLSFRRI